MNCKPRNFRRSLRFLLLTVATALAGACVTLPTQPANPAAVSAPTPVSTFTTTLEAPANGALSPQPTDTVPPASANANANEGANDNASVLLPTVTPTPPAARFDPEQVSIALRTVVEGLERPVFVTHAGDKSGRLFIVEKGGAIRILADGVLVPDPLLDITEQVNSSGSEQGLLGLAFAPNFGESRFFYVNYTALSGDTVVERYQISPTDPNQAEPISASTVFTLEDPARNHNGGMLVFGPDGYLWVGLGDGGGAMDTFGNGQNPQTLLGKMLRLDVTSDPSQPYRIPPDNPWVTAGWNGQDVRDEIWAIGLRNPWRYSFDRLTGDLWIGDVGQNQYEEIDLVPAGHAGGLNFGWPLMEGEHCLDSDGCTPADFYPPLTEYAHSPHCSVTGGYVYRGSQFPALQGVYFYADYCSGTIWAAWPDGSGGWTTAQVLDTDATISSFGEDEAGELYVTDLSAGTVSQLVVSGGA